MAQGLRVEFSSEVTELEIMTEDSKEEHHIDERKSNWNKGLISSAMFSFKLLGLINYTCDVGSDIVNGYDYLRARNEWPNMSNNSDYNYTRKLCDDWESYRHVKIGTLTLTIVFLPSAIGVFLLGKFLSFW